MLSDRRQRILYALIEEYVAHAIPVGSQTIAKQYRLGVSSATIRNELSILEDEGYIIQPHTSAGRIPTDAGYREFVDGILDSYDNADTLIDDEARALQNRIRGHADALDELMERTTAELTRLTDCLSIIMAPSICSARIRQISLISLSDSQALIVIVLENGRVINQTIYFDVEVGADYLFELQSVFSDILIGSKLGDADAYDRAKTLNKIASDPIANKILEEIFQSLDSAGQIKATQLGLSTLLRKPEFHDSSSLLPLMEVLEDDSILFGLLDDGDCDNKHIVVRIGGENAKEQLSGVSVVAGTYGSDTSQGVVAVIGPKRMNYSTVIKAVRAAQDALNE